MTKIRLTERDKKILLCVTLGGVLLFIVMAGVLPFMESKARLQKGIAAKRAAIPEMEQFARQYQASHHGGEDIAQRLAAQDKGFSLFPFLEAKSSEAGVADKIKYMKPMTAATAGEEFSESLVEMKLEGVSLEQLLGYLGKIELPEQLISVKRISIQQGIQADALLDVVVQVASIGR